MEHLLRTTEVYEHLTLRSTWTPGDDEVIVCLERSATGQSVTPGQVSLVGFDITFRADSDRYTGTLFLHEARLLRDALQLRLKTTKGFIHRYGDMIQWRRSADGMADFCVGCGNPKDVWARTCARCAGRVPLEGEGVSRW